MTVHKLKLSLEMISDWHVGSGEGQPGNIDRMVCRDSDGLPYVPAKTLTGIWRDACEQVSVGLDHNQSRTWQERVKILFGDQPALEKHAVESPPMAALLSIRPARLPQLLRNALVGKSQLKEALTFIKPGIKIDSNSGTAEKDCLRMVEMVRGGVTLEFEAELSLRGCLRRLCSGFNIASTG